MFNIAHLLSKTVYVVGIGSSNLSVVNFFQKQKIKHYVWDDNIINQQYIAPAKINWSQIDFLLLTPGISDTHLAANLAKKNKVPIINDIELLKYLAIPGKTIGITGTNGKSTTASLIHYLLQENGYKSLLAGNIGQPVFNIFKDLEQTQYVVLELSSYQLARTNNFYPDVAIWLNIAPDHLEYHNSIENYITAKKNIFAPKGCKQDIIIAIDDKYSFNIYQQLQQDSAKNIIPIDTTLIQKSDTLAGDGKDLHNFYAMHNTQNIAVAIAACSLLNILTTKEQLQNFPPLSHRLEIYRIINNITFINDSKATNMHATEKALKTLRTTKHIFLIMGGQLKKEDDISFIKQYKNILKGIFLIGQDAPKLHNLLEEYNITSYICHTLEKAVHKSYQNACQIDLDTEIKILFSPGCSSFDKYQNFIARGNDFKNIVNKIK